MAATTPSTRRSIPLARPDIGEREIELVNEVLHSDVLAMGGFTERFEAGIASLAGRREGVACSSGTAGLHLGVRALGIGEGDEVLTTPFSFVASSNCLLYERAIPRFVDIEADSLGMDPDRLAGAAGPRTRAVLPVHVFGRPCRIGAIDSIARDRGWSDDRGFLRSAWFDRSTDARPAASATSPSLPSTPTSRSPPAKAEWWSSTIRSWPHVMRSLRNQGRDADGTWLRHVRLGYNYRLDELSAALGVAQVERRAELERGGPGSRPRTSESWAAGTG